MLRLKRYTEPADFLGDARAYLERQEVVNDLMLGLAIRLLDDPLLYGSPPYFAAVKDRDLPVLAALMTPPHNLILASEGEGEPEAVELVARDLIEGRWPAPGALGPVRLAEAFARCWERLTGAAGRTVMNQRVYELRRVVRPRYSPGRLRTAGEAEFDLVLAWYEAFQREAMPEGSPRPPTNPEALRRRIAEGYYFLWENGVPVAMAAKARPTQRGITVGAVYTPPEQRRRGYATSCVAALSQRLLDEGFGYCMLFTDLSNPTSNHIYQQIGYRPVCDFREYGFS